MIAHEWTWLTIADAVKDPHPPKPVPYPKPAGSER